MTLIDGKQTAADIKKEIAAEVEKMVAQGMRRPHLAAILVGHDGGSETYVASKVKACHECGFESSLLRFEDNITEAELLKAVDDLNNNPEDDGIIELLRRYHIPTRGKHCVVIGRSNIVGKPVAQLMLHKGDVGDATVTICHSASENLPEIVRQADIIIAAVGRPGFVTADMVKDGATVIDVGTTRVPDATRKSGFRLSGDVDFDSVAPKCAYITPVPGGVGPMTICSLMLNTLQAAHQRNT